MLEPFYPPGVIQIDCLYSIHYFPFAGGYLFPGETHAFWEMVYIDQGEAEIGAGEKKVRLSQGQAIFHCPNEFHSIFANAQRGTNVFVISFGSSSPAMEAFVGRVCLLDESQRRLIRRMVRQGERAFGPVLDVPIKRGMKQPPNGSQASAQMLVVLLTQLLLELVNQPSVPSAPKPAALTDDLDFAPIWERIVALMRRRRDGLCFEEICREVGFGETMLKKRFKRYTGCTVMAYYQQLRLEESRRLLRQGDMSVSQVAEAMGYSSPQAFSRQFKRIVGVCPVAYLKMVKD